MSWEDENFEIPADTNAAVADDWEQEAEGGDDDKPLLESWDVDIDELEKQKKEKEAKEKAEKAALKKKQKEALERKKKKKSGKPTLLKIDKVDESTRRKMLKEAQVKEDMKNAADLFAGMQITNNKDENGDDEDLDKFLEGDEEDEDSPSGTITVDTPLDVHPLFKAEDKDEYVKLRKALEAEMKKIAQGNPLLYANNLAIDLVVSMCQPLKVEQTRKVISTLNVQIRNKLKEERQARLSKTGGTSLGGAGKKKAKGKRVNFGSSGFRKDDIGGMLADEGVGGDDFGDDDFM
ncbi:hypothetical protein HII13_001365 [Brettanomyces bruxellensis]|nr:hypothetical protein HII13_001365 [Brettanomyces bruxellensis]